MAQPCKEELFDDTKFQEEMDLGEEAQPTGYSGPPEHTVVHDCYELPITEAETLESEASRDAARMVQAPPGHASQAAEAQPSHASKTAQALPSHASKTAQGLPNDASKTAQAAPNHASKSAEAAPNHASKTAEATPRYASETAEPAPNHASEAAEPAPNHASETAEPAPNHASETALALPSPQTTKVNGALAPCPTLSQASFEDTQVVTSPVRPAAPCQDSSKPGLQALQKPAPEPKIQKVDEPQDEQEIDLDELLLQTSKPPPVPSPAAIDQRVRRIMKKRSDGTYVVPEEFVKAWLDQRLGGRETIMGMFEKVNYEPAPWIQLGMTESECLCISCVCFLPQGCLHQALHLHV